MRSSCIGSSDTLMHRLKIISGGHDRKSQMDTWFGMIHFSCIDRDAALEQRALQSVFEVPDGVLGEDAYFASGRPPGVRAAAERDVDGLGHAGFSLCGRVAVHQDAETAIYRYRRQTVSHSDDSCPRVDQHSSLFLIGFRLVLVPVLPVVF